MTLKTLPEILCWILGAYGLLLVLAYIFQNRLIYFPTSEVNSTPAEVGLSFHKVPLQTDDGLTLSAWYLPSEPDKGTILFCHGNAGNMGHRLDSLRIFHKLGWNVLIFDYRGYGESPGRPSEAGTGRDALAAWRYLVETKGEAPSRIVIFGRSLGAAVAAELAANQAPAGLIVESAFVSLPDLAADLYRLFPARWLCRYRYNTLASVRRVKCPVLVVHSREDEIIPYAHALRLLESAPGPKRLLTLRGDHNAGFLLTGKDYEEGLWSFLDGAALGHLSPRQ